ncbi:MAG TPA: 2Fe-2S iron-sulfur cluster-binding protein, partial [Candidatus Limnocylindrales bacterium]
MTEPRHASASGAEAPPPAGEAGRVVVDGAPLPYIAGDSVAVAVLRSSEHPARGGTLCLAGDCGNCVAEVDGVAYVRTCQTPAVPGLVVRRHPGVAMPPLPVVTAPDLGATLAGREIAVRRIEVDLAIVGGGTSGREARIAAERAGRAVLALDAEAGDEVVAIYAGQVLIVRTPAGMLHVHAREIVVATGAAEIHPVCPGNRLTGLFTARAAERLQAAGVDLGTIEAVVAVGTPPTGVPCTPLPGRLVRFEGEGRVRAVVTADAAGTETTTSCDAVILGLGRAPRDLLARMDPGRSATVVGPAAEVAPLPPPPTDGLVCPCSGTTVADLQGVWDRGFNELELIKRASLAGVGTCQGGACLPHVRSWIAVRTGATPEPFTARPASRQITLAEAAADTYVDAFRHTPLHDEHLALGARMDRFGTWWRPWHYGDHLAEYWAVREAVSIGDVST